MSSAASVAPASDVTAIRAANRRRMVWIMLFCASPFVLATLVYFWWKPHAGTSVGVFLDPKAAIDAPLVTPAGESAPLSALRGKWLLLSVTGERCLADCLDTLHRGRQFRLAQAEEMDRLQRVLIARSPLAASDSAARLEEAVVRVDVGGKLVQQLPVGAAGQAGAIYLLDPNGNLVMRYDSVLEPIKVIREIKKILKINNGLG